MALRKIETLTGKTFVQINGNPVETRSEQSFEVSQYVQVRDVAGAEDC